MRVLSGCNDNPSPTNTSPIRRFASSARLRLVVRTTKSSAYLTNVPRLVAFAQASSMTWRAMLASNGEMGEPCGVPDSVSETNPPSNTPARSQLRSSFNICRSKPGVRPDP